MPWTAASLGGDTYATIRTKTKKGGNNDSNKSMKYIPHEILCLYDTYPVTVTVFTAGVKVKDKASIRSAR